MMLPNRLPCLAVALLWSVHGAAIAGPGAATTRPPTAQEGAAFQAFYQKNYGAAPAQTLYRIDRSDAKSAWRVSATVDGIALRGLRTLCRMERIEFNFERRWIAARQPRQFVWVQGGACRASPHAIELLQRMPDTDALALLGAQAAALPKARLIMAGNSACAPLRSFRFRFAAIDVGRAGASSEEMAGLVYRSDGDAQVTVWVRKNGNAIDNWSVSCPPRMAAP